jgi:hypothetical protein
MAKLNYAWPCRAKRGMVSFGGNVYYPTNLGLASIGVSGENIVTERYYAQRDWEALGPETFVAAHYAGAYYARYTGTDALRSGIVVITGSEGVVNVNLHPSELWTDPTTGELYAQTGSAIYDMNATEGARRVGTWASKEFLLPKPLNLGAAQINARFTLTPEQRAINAAWNANVLAYNQSLTPATLDGAVNAHPVNTRAINASGARTDFKSEGGSINFALWANGVIIHSAIVLDQNMFRLPSGLKYDNFAVQVTSDVSIESIVIAETAHGLRGA